MAGYNEIRGLKVKYLSADPSNAEDGEVWYNSTLSKLRVEGIVGTGSWSSGGALPTANYTGAGFGISTAAVYAGGGSSKTTTFEYDGSSWTA